MKKKMIVKILAVLLFLGIICAGIVIAPLLHRILFRPEQVVWEQEAQDTQLALEQTAFESRLLYPFSAMEAGHSGAGDTDPIDETDSVNSAKAAPAALTDEEMEIFLADIAVYTDAYERLFELAGRTYDASVWSGLEGQDEFQTLTLLSGQTDRDVRDGSDAQSGHDAQTDGDVQDGSDASSGYDTQADRDVRDGHDAQTGLGVRLQIALRNYVPVFCLSVPADGFDASETANGMDFLRAALSDTPQRDRLRAYVEKIDAIYESFPEFRNRILQIYQKGGDRISENEMMGNEKMSLWDYCQNTKWQVFSAGNLPCIVSITKDFSLIIFFDPVQEQFCGFNIAPNTGLFL